MYKNLFLKLAISTISVAMAIQSVSISSMADVYNSKTKEKACKSTICCISTNAKIVSNCDYWYTSMKINDNRVLSENTCVTKTIDNSASSVNVVAKSYIVSYDSSPVNLGLVTGSEYTATAKRYTSIKDENRLNTNAVSITQTGLPTYPCKWLIDDNSIAVVDKNGNIKALKSGNTKVFAYFADNKFIEFNLTISDDSNDFNANTAVQEDSNCKAYNLDKNTDTYSLSGKIKNVVTDRRNGVNYYISTEQTVSSNNDNSTVTTAQKIEYMTLSNNGIKTENGDKTILFGGDFNVYTSSVLDFNFSSPENEYGYLDIDYSNAAITYKNKTLNYNSNNNKDDYSIELKTDYGWFKYYEITCLKDDMMFKCTFDDTSENLKSDFKIVSGKYIDEISSLNDNDESPVSAIKSNKNVNKIIKTKDRKYKSSINKEISYVTGKGTVSNTITMELDTTEITMKSGQKTTVNATITGKGLSQSKILAVSSSKKDIATATLKDKGNGKYEIGITALKEGTSIITVTGSNQMVLCCEVTIK